MVNPATAQPKSSDGKCPFLLWRRLPRRIVAVLPVLAMTVMGVPR